MDENEDKKEENIDFPHGDHVLGKEYVRYDSATTQFPIIFFEFSLGVLLRFSIGTVKIKNVYLQAAEFTRDVFIRPTKGWNTDSTLWKLVNHAYVIMESERLWKFENTAYRIVESGRLWKIVIDECIFDYGEEQFTGILQIFVKRDHRGVLILVI